MPKPRTATEGTVAELARRTARLDIGLAVSSAGIVTSGPFLGNDPDTGSAQLAHVYGKCSPAAAAAG